MRSKADETFVIVETFIYPATFFDNVFKHFLNAETDVEEKLDEDKRTICFFRVPYIDKESRRFVTSLSRLIASGHNIKLYTIFATSKVGDYLQLKCRTSHAFAPTSFISLRVRVMRTSHT